MRHLLTLPLMAVLLCISLPASAEVKVFYVGDNDCTLSWTPPETRVGGAVLNSGDISHYKIYLGTDPEFAASVLLIRETSNTSLECDLPNKLPAGTYYEGLSVVDKNGRESELSEAVSFILIDKPITPPNPPTQLQIGGTIVGGT